MRNIQIGSSITHELAPLFRRVSRVHNDSLRGLGLRAVDGHILALLLEEGELSVGEVSARLGVIGSTLTGAVDRLEKKGLLTRKLAPGDRRSFLLTPAKLPAKQTRALAGALDEAEAACFGRMSAKDRRDLLRLLQKANALFDGGA